jgi:hypothetical protein
MTERKGFAKYLDLPGFPVGRGILRTKVHQGMIEKPDSQTGTTAVHEKRGRFRGSSRARILILYHLVPDWQLYPACTHLLAQNLSSVGSRSLRVPTGAKRRALPISNQGEHNNLVWSAPSAGPYVERCEPQEFIVIGEHNCRLKTWTGHRFCIRKE